MNHPHESESLPVGPLLTDYAGADVDAHGFVGLDVDMDMDYDDDASTSSGSSGDDVFSPRGAGVGGGGGGGGGDDDSDDDMDVPDDEVVDVYYADHHHGDEEDDDDDNGSVSSDSSFRSLVSLTESVYRSREEHGRFYPAYFSGDYMFPDDPKHQWFLEALHQTYYHSSGQRLHYCPGPEGPHRVLDMGTGPGSWAVDYATVHPEAQVIGVDISPIQPTMVPENCSFEVDHLEQEWTWSQPFDLIYWRFLHGCFADVRAMVQKCYDNLAPGGWLETFDGLTLRINQPVPADSALVRLVGLATEASVARGRPLDQAHRYPRVLLDAGFRDVVFGEVHWPVNGRTMSGAADLAEPAEPADEPDLGHYASYTFGCDLEGLFLALLCRDGGPLSYEEAEALCEAAREELRTAPMNAQWIL